MVEEIADICRYFTEKSKMINPHIPIVLSLIVTGFDKKSGDLFLYELSSMNNYNPIEPNKADNLIIRGVSPEVETSVFKYLFENGNQALKSNEELFVAGIRHINHEEVSKETIGITLINNKGKSQGYRLSIDDSGETVQDTVTMDNNVSEIL